MAVTSPHMKQAPLLALVVLLTCVGRTRALEWNPSALSTIYVNSALQAQNVTISQLDMYSPVFTGFGADTFGQMTLNVVRDKYNWSDMGLLVGVADNGYSPEATIRLALSAGYDKGYLPPKMIFIYGGLVDAGWAARSRDNSNMNYLRIPVVQVSVYVWEVITILDELTAANGSLRPLPISVIVRDDDPDPFNVLWPKPTVIIIGIILGAMGVCCLVLNAYKSYYAYRFGPVGLTNIKIYLVGDLFAQVCRIWYCVGNPFFVNQIAFTWTTVAQGLSIAMAVIGTLLIVFNWQEVLLKSSKFKTSTPYLDRFHWPFVGLSSVTFLLVLVSGCYAGYWYSLTLFANISWGFLVAASILVVIWLEITGVLVMLTLRRNLQSDVHHGRTHRAYSKTLMIMASGMCLLGWALTHMAAMIMGSVGTITLASLNATTTMEFVFVFLCSAIQTWSMSTPSANGEHSSALSSNPESVMNRTRSGSIALGMVP